MAAYLKWCGFLAREAVEQNWAKIGRFARRLADAGELEGRELEAALTSKRGDSAFFTAGGFGRIIGWSGPRVEGG